MAKTLFAYVLLNRSLESIPILFSIILNSLLRMLPVFAYYITGLSRPQNRFLLITKPVFADIKTGFYQSHNRFLPITKPIFADIKTGVYRS